MFLGLTCLEETLSRQKTREQLVEQKAVELYHRLWNDPLNYMQRYFPPLNMADGELKFSNDIQREWWMDLVERAQLNSDRW